MAVEIREEPYRAFLYENREMVALVHKKELALLFAAASDLRDTLATLLWAYDHKGVTTMMLDAAREVLTRAGAAPAPALEVVPPNDHDSDAA